MQLLENARRAAPSGSRGGYVPNISPYKDGAYPRSDANSFPICTLNIRRRPRGKGAAETNISELPLLPSPFLQRLLTGAGRRQHLIEGRFLPQVFQ